jgi:hypothetical protein
MSLPVVLIPEARDEFDEAFDWYERQKKGLGITFSDHVQRVYGMTGSPRPLRCIGSFVRTCARPG